MRDSLQSTSGEAVNLNCGPYFHVHVISGAHWLISFSNKGTILKCLINQTKWYADRKGIKYSSSQLWNKWNDNSRCLFSLPPQSFPDCDQNINRGGSKALCSPSLTHTHKHTSTALSQALSSKVWVSHEPLALGNHRLMKSNTVTFDLHSPEAPWVPCIAFNHCRSEGDVKKWLTLKNLTMKDEV